MPSKTLYVSLNKKCKPKVQVDADVRGKAKMKWRKDTDSPDYFDFVKIDFDHNPSHFIKTRRTNSKINATFDLSTGEHPYTITVKDSAGDPHTTNIKTSPRGPGDKPVIRN